MKIKIVFFLILCCSMIHLRAEKDCPKCRTHPATGGPYYHAKELYDKENYKCADKCFEEIPESDKGYKAHHYHAETLKKLGRHDQAQKEIEKAKDCSTCKRPNHAMERHLLGYNECAIDCYERAGQHTFRDDYYLARAYYEMGIYDKAQEQLYKATDRVNKLKLDGLPITADWSRKLNSLASKVAKHHKKYKKAEAYNKQAIVAEEKYKEAINEDEDEEDDDENGNNIIEKIINRGRIQYTLQHYEKACDIWEKGLEDYPDANEALRSELNYMLGNVTYFELGNERKGITCWERALELNDNKYALLSMACHTYKNGNDNESNDYLARLYLTNMQEDEKEKKDRTPKLDPRNNKFDEIAYPFLHNAKKDFKNKYSAIARSYQNEL